ncbi:MAG: hypothetical protein KDC03_11840 [Flavobacteriales bacterium]|nr:hypothetical protein [Flavobacteriales bacterium]
MLTHQYMYKASIMKAFIAATGIALLEKPGSEYKVIDSYYALCEVVRQVLMAHLDFIESDPNVFRYGWDRVFGS